MTQKHSQVQQVFPFWRAVEALTPQKLDKDNPDDNFNPSYKMGFNGVLPWSDAKHTRKKLAYQKVWRYTVQFGVYDLSQLSKLLEDKIGRHEDVLEGRVGGKSRLFDISFNELGIPQYESFMLSLPVWAAGQILQHERGVSSLEQSIPTNLVGLPSPSDKIPFIDSGFSDFDQLTQHLMQWISNEAARFKHEQITADVVWLKHLAEVILDKTKFPISVMDNGKVCLVKCTQVNACQHGVDCKQDNKADSQKSKNKTEKSNKEISSVALPDDMLNSFFIHDLGVISSAWQRKNYGLGFSEYMCAIADPERRRINIRSKLGLKSAFEGLLPTQAPLGAWPSQYPLAFSQQLAVNEIWRSHANHSGIFAVNGPPGTGKTTLLRDVVAAVVTQRALSLVTNMDDVFTAKKTIKIGDKRIPYHPLHSAIKGASIVVASANNGAVENISLELPGEDAVPKSVLDQSDYFADLASELMGKRGWGLLAAKLGNKGNRNDFMNIFWWRRPTEKKNDATLLPDIFTPKRGEGLSYHLKLLKDGKRAPSIKWSDAVLRFENARKLESNIRSLMVKFSTLNAQIDTLQRSIQESEPTCQSIISKLNQARTERQRLDSEVFRFEEDCRERLSRLGLAEQRLKQHESNKPGFLAWIATFGRTHRAWWERYHSLSRELDFVYAEVQSQQHVIKSLKSKITKVQGEIKKLDLKLNEANGFIINLKDELKSTSILFEQAKNTMGDCWPDPNASDDVREKSTPWAHKDWLKAREEMFLAALDVHRSFIENNPSQMLANMNLVSDWLQGKDLPEDLAAIALDSLCLIVPVISTTFASIPRMFKNIGREAIGWLLIDEAGQALPQQAASAIWRASRTVVVGDPKQLEPVSGLPPSVEGALAKTYCVPSIWWPSEVSAQVLADQTMGLGTHLPTPDNGKVWVGCPLRVHRRCDDPMFSVSNKIAYDGLMVHGKKETHTQLPESGWIDVVGKNCEGNWIVEEGEAVKKLLLELRTAYGVKPENIFLISPFLDCAKQLRRLAAQLGFDTHKTGTVHTTQGKEASVVVFVLGGNIQKPGAKAWAASRPNLLNVAVSRAKQRLYVIGDRSEWKKQRYFSTLVQDLPKIEGVSPEALLAEDVL